MFSSFKFFEKEHDKYLRIDFALDARMAPSKLINEYKSASAKKQLAKALTKKTQNGFKIMRKLTIAHQLIMYSNNMYDVVEQFADSPMLSSDQWLNDHCITTYYHFLKKVVASQEMFVKVKEYSSKELSFQMLFYLINLMIDMFRIVAKMPLLGRYFKDANEIVTSSFVETIAVQAQKFYTVFKNSLQQILTYPKAFIQNKEDQKIMKAILEDSLISLNEEMKKLFLDKYFYPYGKGIGIRLFRTEEQPEQTIKVINGIISDHKETERNLAQANLQKTMFPEEGQVNIQFFERTLKPSDNKNQEVYVKDLDDIEEQQYMPTQFEQTKIIGEQKFQKQTSHHMEIVEDV